MRHCRPLACLEIEYAEEGEAGLSPRVMKYRVSFMIAFWWIMLCLILGAFLLVYADKDDRESTTENRMLQGFPEMSAENSLRFPQNVLKSMLKQTVFSMSNAETKLVLNGCFYAQSLLRIHKKL